MAAAFLLDFDGPVCDLFPHGSTSRIAEDARTPILSAGIELPEELADTREHLKVLKYAGEHAPAVLEQVEQAAIAGELEAARHAPITPGVREFLKACARTDRPVVVVSNNAGAAIEDFLDRHDLAQLVVAVLGRPYARPDLMKPNPYRAHEAFRLLGRGAESCAMIGDETSDVAFARAAGMRAIAYAKSPKEEPGLQDAAPDEIITSMASLATRL